MGTATRLALLFVIVASDEAVAQGGYTYRELPPLAGDSESSAVAANDRGDVVGQSLAGRRGERIAVWHGDAVTTSEVLYSKGLLEAYPTDINLRGEVVGYGVGALRSVAWVWDAVNGMRELPALSTKGRSWALAINDFGVIVGFSTDANGRETAVRWDPGQPPVDLGGPTGYVRSSAFDVNNAGEIVLKALVGSTPTDCRVDASGQLQPLGTLGKANADATAINALGTIVGESGELVTWVGTTPTGHGTPPGLGGYGVSINANEQMVVVTSNDPGTSNHLHLAGAFVDLLTLLPPTLPVVEADAVHVNDGGLVSGSAVLKSTGLTAFVLEPETRIEPLGGALGGTIEFRHAAPLHPGVLAATLVSLTGMSQPFALGRGASVLLDFDATTLAVLELPGVGLVTLDGAGLATTAAIDIPADPSLAGLPVWVANGLIRGGRNAPIASTTVPFHLQ
jgi:probable HAF family extracellular repeat protein